MLRSLGFLKVGTISREMIWNGDGRLDRTDKISCEIVKTTLGFTTGRHVVRYEIEGGDKAEVWLFFQHLTVLYLTSFLSNLIKSTEDNSDFCTKRFWTISN